MHYGFVLFQSSSMEMDGEAVRELRNRTSIIKEHGIGKYFNNIYFNLLVVIEIKHISFKKNNNHVTVQLFNPLRGLQFFSFY